MIIETKRLIIRKVTFQQEDVDFLFSLWTNPQVMKFVGFPFGLKITKGEIRKSITKQNHSEFDEKLIVQLKKPAKAIGECKLGLPDPEGICITDVKLLPEFWGQGYGTEVKQSLVDYLFSNTNCQGIKATPNKINVASQKMQEAVGGIKVGEELFTFPEHMRDYTSDVHSYVYIVYRQHWEEKQRKKS